MSFFQILKPAKLKDRPADFYMVLSENVYKHIGSALMRIGYLKRFLLDSSVTKKL